MTTSRQSAGGEAGFAQVARSVSDANLPVAETSKTLAAKDAPSSSQVAQAVKQVNDAFSQKGLALYASFEKDKITGIDIVQIKEKKSNEVIRQLPLKGMVAFAQSLELPEGWRGQWIRNMS